LINPRQQQAEHRRRGDTLAIVGMQQRHDDRHQDEYAEFAKRAIAQQGEPDAADQRDQPRRHRVMQHNDPRQVRRARAGPAPRPSNQKPYQAIVYHQALLARLLTPGCAPGVLDCVPVSVMILLLPS